MSPPHRCRTPALLQEVALGHKTLTDYTHIVGKDLTEQIRELAEPLKGKRVLHVSATAFGGGVSEILYTLVPLMRDVGLDAHWHVIFGKEEFYNATKLLHNSLQGAEETLSDEQWEIFDEINQINAEGLQGEWDVVIVHDPQPIGLLPRREGEGRQLDLALPHRPLDAEPGADRPPAADDRRVRRERLAHGEVRSRRDGQAPRGGADRAAGDRPALAEEHGLLPEDAAFVCRQFGIDVDRPLITQVSRFDPWKDPIGVIDAYRQVTEKVPEAQLAMVGSMATDDPEGMEYFQKTFEYADGDEDIKILSNLNNVGAIEVNAFQSQSDVCLQKSIREGFGLTVTEALWKGRPTVGRQRRRHPAADRGRRSAASSSTRPRSAPSAASRSSTIPGLGKQLGREGKEHARREFLTPRLLRDWLELFDDLDG